MKKKILGVALVIAGLTSVGMIHSASKRRDLKDQQDDRHGTYQQRLQRAKARGDKKIRSYGVIPLYAGVSFDQALDIYDFVIGEFVSSKKLCNRRQWKHLDLVQIQDHRNAVESQYATRRGHSARRTLSVSR